jgi:hypothetical protein
MRNSNLGKPSREPRHLQLETGQLEEQYMMPSLTLFFLSFSTEKIGFVKHRNTPGYLFIEMTSESKHLALKLITLRGKEISC